MLTEKRIVPYSFEEIYVSYFSRMKYFALEYVLSEEDAENIVQDVFTELWERKELLTYNINGDYIPLYSNINALGGMGCRGFKTHNHGRKKKRT